LFAPSVVSFDLTNDCYAFIILNMRLHWRTIRRAETGAAQTAGRAGTAGTADRALRRDVALVCLADGIVGVSFGATTVAGGLHWWVPVVMSLLVFAGGSQIAAVGVVLAGGGAFAAVAAGAVLNTRMFPYGLAVADVTSGSPDADGSPRVPGRRWWIRLAGAQIVTDESVAFALRHTDPARRRASFWTCGVSLFTVWNVAVLLGVLAGSAMRNTAAFGLDATFPAVLLALALPTLADRGTRTAALSGATAAVALTPLLPAGVPVLAALGGLATMWRPRRRRTRASGPGASRSPGPRLTWFNGPWRVRSPRGRSARTQLSAGGDR
jgi:predicted branched-subunit amino acid permease